MSYTDSFMRWVDPATIDWTNTIVGIFLVIVCLAVFASIRGYGEMSFDDLSNESEDVDGHVNARQVWRRISSDWTDNEEIETVKGED